MARLRDHMESLGGLLQTTHLARPAHFVQEAIEKQVAALDVRAPIEDTATVTGADTPNHRFDARPNGNKHPIDQAINRQTHRINSRHVQSRLRGQPV